MTAIETMPPAAESQRSEIVFIESNVTAYQSLLDDVDPGVEVHVLDASQDGLRQIAQILAGRSGIDALHIVSHGAEGSLQLGATDLTAQNLQDHAAELAAIGGALNAAADILLYGCDVAKGSAGAALVSALALATQADIAASTDLTGAAAKGGDWELEYATGFIDAPALQASGYQEVLLNATFDCETATGSITGIDTAKTVTQVNTAASETLRIVASHENITGANSYGGQANLIGGAEAFVAGGISYDETLLTFDLTSGKNFDLTSIKFSEWAGAAETLVLTSSKGSTTFALNAAGGTQAFDVSANVNAAFFVGISSFTISSQDGHFATAFDDIALQNITAAGPTVTSATYDASTNSLVVTGTGMSATGGAANDIDVTKLTLSGQGGATYTLTSSNVEITSATQFTVALNAVDQINVEGLLNKNGTSAVDATNYNIAAAADWNPANAGNADLTGNAVTLSSVQTPAIGSATYDAGSGVLAVTGSNLVKASGVTNDITVSKLTLTGEGGATYTLTTANVEITDATSFSVTLNATDQAAVDQLLNKTGTASTGGTTYNVAAADDWNTVIGNADTSDATSPLTVSNPTTPAITAATYNAGTGALVVTGSGFLKLSGATNDIDVSKLTIAGEGGATYTLTTSSVEISSATAFTVTLNATDLAGVNQILNKTGTASTGGATYNLAAAEDWAAGAAAAVNVVDASGNGITVSNPTTPAISATAYDASSGVLTLSGSGFLKLSGATNDIVANKFTFTGEGGATYTLTDTANIEITSATSATLTLSATDKAAVNLLMNKDGTSSTSGTTYNVNAAEDWAAGADASVNVVDASNAVTVSNVPAPAITSATYDYNSNTLVVSGTGFLSKSGATNDIDISKLTFTGEGAATYTLTSASDVEIASATQFTVTLSGADLTNVEALLNKNGTASVSNTTYNLAGAAGWNAGDANSSTDTTGNGITVSNWAAPTVSSATYDWSNGQLVVTGTNFVNASGANNDIIANKLTLTGEGGSYTLTDSANVEITSATAATLTLSATDKLNIHGILNKNGSTSSSATTYNVAAADDWLAGSPSASDIADATGNGITVSNVATPTITSATYDSDSGILAITGTNLFKKVGASNDVDISKLTFTGGTGNATYTLTSASDVEISSATSISVTLSGADKTSVDALLDQMGTTSTGGSTYNLAAADDWLAGADAATDISDANNAITVSISPRITSATYNANTGVLVVSAANLQAKAGAVNDIAVSKLTLSGEGGSTYTLTTSDVELDSATQFTVTLNATDKAALNQIVNKDGTSSTGNTAYNLAAADDWNAQVTAGDTADASNAVTASSVAAPTIASATYDAATGALVVTGSGFLKLSGATNDIDVSKLSIAGEGGATYTLTTSSVEISSATAFTVTLNATDLAGVNQILNKTGTASTGGATYNLAAAEDWAAGAAAAVNVVDASGNGITVSNPTTPTIASATYNTVNGTLVVSGSGFLKLSGATNDIVANKFTITGEGGATYTLTDSANVEITSATSFTLTLSATDKTAVAALVNKAGTSATGGTTYNVAAAEDWAAGAAAAVNVADLAGNGITATVNQAPVITSNGGAATAAINIAENGTAVTTVTATDADTDTPSFSISGGTDQAKFTINAASGVLAFATAPDFETPTDSDTNNTYVVQVTANDGNGGTDVQAITVTVTDVSEGGGSTPPASTTSTVDGTTVQTDTANSGGRTITTATVAPVTATRQEDTSTANSSLADIPLVKDGSGDTLLQVSLPTGVGLTSQAISGGGTTLRDLLISASSPKVTDSAVFNKILADGIDTYVPDVQDQNQVTVRTITFSNTSTAAGQTIVVSGSLGTGEHNSAHPLRQEALVIDTRSLPAGAAIKLDNVEFAIVVGAANLTGGGGNNFVVGDNASQTIYSGDGNDVLSGGGGTDLVRGGKDSDKGTFNGASDRYKVSFEYGKTIVTSLDNPGDVTTLVNVESLKFADQSLDVTSHSSSLSWIATIYQQALGRQADLGGFQFWAAQTAGNGVSTGTATISLLSTGEVQQRTGVTFGALDGAAQIDFLYAEVLGRAADAAGKAYWAQQYANGASIGDIATNIVQSAELTGKYLVPTGWDFFV